MAGWEILLAALVGMSVGALVATFFGGRRARRALRERVELEARVRRSVVPVLERRADVLGIPPSSRGSNADGALSLMLTLADAIQSDEERGELPYGDTLEVSRKELDKKLAIGRGGKV